jgi:hypothetical protein
MSTGRFSPRPRSERRRSRTNCANAYGQLKILAAIDCGSSSCRLTYEGRSCHRFGTGFRSSKKHSKQECVQEEIGWTGTG